MDTQTPGSAPAAQIPTAGADFDPNDASLKPPDGVGEDGAPDADGAAPSAMAAAEGVGGKSQNGFPASPNAGSIGVRVFSVPGRPDVRMSIRADIAPLLLDMAQWWNANVEPLVVAEGCYGYNYRPIRGSSQLSNHASGTAIDLNATKHPMGVRGTLGSKKDAVIEKARSLGVRSGAEYTGRVDEMHVEVNVSPERALQLVAELHGGNPAPAPAPGPSPAPAPGPSGLPTLQNGSRGDAVTKLQQTLNRWYPKLPALTVDGVFGAATHDRVVYFQQHAGLAADGVVGPKTWAALGFH